MPGQTGLLTGNVDVTRIPRASYAQIYAFGAQGAVSSGELALSSSLSLDAPAGSDRVEALAYNLTALAGSILTSLVAAKNFDNQPVPGALNGGSPVVLMPADQTSPQTLSYQGLPSGYEDPTVVVSLVLGGPGTILVEAGQANTYPALPAQAMESADVYTFSAAAYQKAIPGVSSRSAVLSVLTSHAGGPKTLTFPAPWTWSGPALSAFPAFSFAYTGFSGMPGVMNSALLWAPGFGGTFDIIYNYEATAASLSGSPTLTYPNLSGITGFSPAPASGASVFWVAEITQSDAGSTQGSTADWSSRAVLSQGTFRVP